VFVGGYACVLGGVVCVSVSMCVCVCVCVCVRWVGLVSGGND